MHPFDKETPIMKLSIQGEWMQDCDSRQGKRERRKGAGVYLSFFNHQLNDSHSILILVLSGKQLYASTVS